jgi:hypothetical protein
MRAKLLLLATAALCLANSLYTQTKPTTSLQALSKGLPISFEENHGQVDSEVRFLAHMGKNSIFFTPSEAVLVLYDNSKENGPTGAVRTEWIGANPNPAMSVEKELPGRVNYLTGSDPARWHTNLPTFSRVRYGGIFPGVDAVFYGKDGEIEYDLEAGPGADVHKIRFALTGAESVRLSQNGDLVLQFKNGEARQRRPRVYQAVAGKRHWLSARYVIYPDSTIGYEIAGLDSSKAVVIDPTLSYSTLIGGTSADSVNSVAVDQFGRVYATGVTRSGFPTKNPRQGNQLGDDAFVTKFFATGGGLIYSTYLGGSDSDVGNAIAIDRFGSVYVAGATSSTDFPVTPGAPVLPPHDQSNGFITKLSPSGSTLVYSLLLGGGDSDEITALALDSQHRVYVTGITCSTNFPVKNAFQPVTLAQNCANGGGDAFVARINATGTALDYSTYLDGTFASLGEGIAVDSTFHAYVTGSTESADFPTTPGAFQRTLKAPVIPGDPHDTHNSNAFVTKFSADGRTLVYSTFLGGTTNDAGAAIAVDASNRAYVTGTAQSKDFPITSGALQKTLRGTSDAFITKLQADGKGLIYSTFLGGSGNDGGRSIAVDSLGRAHVAGNTTSTNFPLLNPIQAQFGGVQDAFVARLSATGGILFYSTYLGGAKTDSANSVRLDGSGNAYVGGSTASTNFRTTAGAFSRTLKGTSDGWVAKIMP